MDSSEAIYYGLKDAEIDFIVPVKRKELDYVQELILEVRKPQYLCRIQVLETL